MTKKPSKSKTAPSKGASADTKATTASNPQPLVGIIMGSSSDLETMEHAVETLKNLGVPHETRVVSAHRTPDLLFEYASTAEQRGLEVLIAGAGGAAHLPGMTASKTVLPVLGVPVESKALKGLDSLLSIAQMPGGIPVGTLAIGKAGAINSALLAAAILGAKHPAIREALRKFREEQTERVLANPDPSLAPASGFRLTSPEPPTNEAEEPQAPVPPNAKRKPA
ncbi:MAG: 5-(carboxyamino)imidazole ribonucleotide mutase [Acidobacteria bacterium]|nr:5-(carboxyamino)imidazole ribonucleotide mutase [Acidobacteriota bacterium]